LEEVGVRHLLPMRKKVSDTDFLTKKNSHTCEWVWLR